MKIIGTTKEGFILEATENECANLIGFYYSDFEARKQLKFGNEILVNSLFRQLYDLKNRGESLERCANELEAIASLLRLQAPVVTPASTVTEKEVNQHPNGRVA